MKCDLQVKFRLSKKEKVKEAIDWKYFLIQKKEQQRQRKKSDKMLFVFTQFDPPDPSRMINDLTHDLARAP